MSTQRIAAVCPARPGVTLIEILVSLGVLGVVFAITLPALVNTRSSARELKSLSNARSIAGDMQAYADHTGVWPFAAPGAAPAGYPITPPPGTLTVRWWHSVFITVGSHWEHARLWPGIVAVTAPWEEHYESWVSPGREFPSLFTDDGRPVSLVTTSYLYSNSFIASPALWSGAATADETLIAPTKPSDVAFPANKVLVWDGDLAYLPRPPRRVDGHWLHATPMAFADGHAAVRTPADAAPGVANPLNNNNSTRLHNTPEGVLGRDY